MIVQSTAVINLCDKLGMIHDLPTGSGSLEINISPGKISLQHNLSKVSSVI